MDVGGIEHSDDELAVDFTNRYGHATLGDVLGEREKGFLGDSDLFKIDVGYFHSDSGGMGDDSAIDDFAISKSGDERLAGAADFILDFFDSCGVG